MTMIHEEDLLSAAEHIARKSARYYRQGNEAESAAAQNRMVDCIEASRWPAVFIGNLVERIGRQNALDVMIDKPIVDYVLGPRERNA